MTVKELICASLDVFHIGNQQERVESVLDIMEKVGLPLEYLNRYPHEFSGGQRQRIMIARALVLHPEFVVCDEPVSALDVSVRAQVLNLMRDLQKEFSLTYLFISHDLSVVRYLCDRVMVMYLGKVMEIASKDEIYSNAKHPYTQALLSSIPIPDVESSKQRIRLAGDIPSPFNPPGGCRFHTRCIYACPECSECEPKLQDIGGGHMVACHRCKN
jgi:peptide/nickel transport system ATP-binding protein/oligopeptide transport system ATP-binding protein